MKLIVLSSVCLVLGGCASSPVGADPDLGEAAISIQEEVALNDEMSASLRVISRLYVGDYAAIEWYQPKAGLIALSVLQDARHPAIDNTSLKARSPTQLFREYAPSLEVPRALIQLEEHPEVLQELRSKADLERFVPEADLHRLGVVPQDHEGATFPVSHGETSFACGYTNFYNAVCADAAWDDTWCWANQTGLRTKTVGSLEESQSTLCAFIGTSQMMINISDVGDYPTNWSGHEAPYYINYTGSWLTVTQNRLRSWHGNAVTIVFFEDAYTHQVKGRPSPSSPGAKYQLGLRVFYD